jgi:Zn-finger nucleic acid-binding protein
MPYLNCPRCGLSLLLRASFVAVEICPRCQARGGLRAPLEISEKPLRLLGQHRSSTRPAPERPIRH